MSAPPSGVPVRTWQFAGGLALLAGAIVFWAQSQRYTTTHLVGPWLARHDRLTGRIDYCTTTGCTRVTQDDPQPTRRDPIAMEHDAEERARRYVSCVVSIDTTNVVTELRNCDESR